MSMFGKKQRKMDYIEAAGIKADEETSLANIRMNAPEIIRMYTEAHTLPPSMHKIPAILLSWRFVSYMFTIASFTKITLPMNSS